MCTIAKKTSFMHNGDLNLINFNKDNYTCYSCHEHQDVGLLRCKFHSCLVTGVTMLQSFKEYAIMSKSKLF